MRISDWSSDACSFDLVAAIEAFDRFGALADRGADAVHRGVSAADDDDMPALRVEPAVVEGGDGVAEALAVRGDQIVERGDHPLGLIARYGDLACLVRSEEHTSELQSLMRNSYAVFCLKKKNKH